MCTTFLHIYIRWNWTASWGWDKNDKGEAAENKEKAPQDTGTSVEYPRKGTGRRKRRRVEMDTPGVARCGRESSEPAMGEYRPPKRNPRQLILKEDKAHVQGRLRGLLGLAIIEKGQNRLLFI
jgi:hypothetical protein